MIHKLLSNVRPGVLEKITTTETGIIACIWFPIPFVGDFNTQMMALRLLVMFLKCVDSKSLQNELDKIRGVPKSFMKNELTAAISVGNFHTAKFENSALVRCLQTDTIKAKAFPASRTTSIITTDNARQIPTRSCLYFCYLGAAIAH
ncbi:uncharacterized protein LOC128856409 [Anastrepha ludens]|uniref:uncharacterized protein LOC128856409 n=1 Tax=Anastrepha ludens TaxID=28586 RepID=UPI0023B15888|nr:uncharacterized protein LOC128856409 [Anastrepha ludens]